MQYYISYSTFVDSRLFTLDTRILIFADFPRNYSNFDFCWSPKRLGTNPPLGYYPYYPYYLVVCLYMWYFIHYYPYCPYYLVVCQYLWYFIHYYPYYLVVCLYVIFYLLLPLLLGGLSIYVIFYSLLPLLLGGLSIYVIFSTRMQLKIKMLITLITGNKGKESKIEINILSKFLCTYHRPVGMDVNTIRHYTFIYTVIHSSVMY